MKFSSHRESIARRAVCAGLAATLALGSVPTAALAVDQSDLDAASQKIETLSKEAESLQSSLSETTQKLEDTQYQIDEKQSQIDDDQQKVAQAQQELEQSLRNDYKSGGIDLTSVVLGSSNISDLVSRLYYATKVNESRSEKIESVKQMQEQLQAEQASLKEQQSQQQSAVDTLNSQLADYNDKISEAQSYYNSLSAEQQAQIQAQAQAAAEASQSDGSGDSSATAAVLQQVTQGSSSSTGSAASSTSGSSTSGSTSSGNSSSGSSSSGSTSNSGSSSSGSSNSSSSNKGSSSSGSSSSSSSSSGNSSSSTTGGASGGGLSTAYSMIGVPYVWGGTSASGVDCSGLVCYSYGYKRGRTTYDMIASLKASGDWKTSMSDLKVGDLVFPSSGHVGIYIGNGQMIHAPYPGRTVCIASVYSFIGGGTY